MLTSFNLAAKAETRAFYISLADLFDLVVKKNTVQHYLAPGVGVD